MSCVGESFPELEKSFNWKLYLLGMAYGTFGPAVVTYWYHPRLNYIIL